MSIQKILLKCHLYAALTTSLFLLIVSLTGAILVFEAEIDHMLNPKLYQIQAQSRLLSLDEMLAKVRAAYPNNKARSLSIPADNAMTYQFNLSNGLSVYLNPYTGEIVGTRGNQEAANSLARRLHMLHTRLMAGQTGELIVGVTSALCVFLVLSGVILWWPRKIMTVKKNFAWRRINFDLHNALGIYASFFMFVIAFSGVMIAFEGSTAAVTARLNTLPPPARPTHSTVLPGKKPIKLSEAVRIAEEGLPGARISNIGIPIGDGDKEVLMAFMKFPEDRTPSGRSRVYIDQYSGAVLLAENTRQAQLGTWIQNLKRSVHTGDVFGIASRIVYMLVCLVLASQVVTGLVMWWKPGKSAQRTEVRIEK